MRDTRASTVNGIVIAAGETIQQIALGDAADYERLLAQYSCIARKLCYCSTLDELQPALEPRRTGR